MSKSYELAINQIKNSDEFKKLANIGGHKIYHLEGDALTHTNIVFKAAEKRFGKGHFMTLVALLHDVGKIYSSVCHGENDWTYPHHSDGGAMKLDNFIPRDFPEFKAIQWYIFNHIRPLFWQNKDLKEEFTFICNNLPDDKYNKSLCKLSWLRDLALCDIEGSKSIKPQTELITFLESLTFK